MTLCSFLAVVTALAVIGCSPPTKSRSSRPSISQPSAASSPINTQGENKSTAPAPKGAAYLPGDIQVVAVEFKRKNARLGYELEISYPRINNPRARNERKFNVYVRTLIENEIKNFMAFCSKNRSHPNGRKRRMAYYLGTRFEALYATREVLSINLTMESFTGYVNADLLTVPLNYDLRTGTPLKGLASLFRPKSNFLESIASYCVAELTRRGTSCGGGGVGDMELLRTGTAATAKNYRGWNLTHEGVRITFGEYQVGPGCLGLVSVVVPFDHLREMLRRDVQWFRAPST
jgi:hypothetical protein